MTNSSELISSSRGPLSRSKITYGQSLDIQRQSLPWSVRRNSQLSKINKRKLKDMHSNLSASSDCKKVKRDSNADILSKSKSTNNSWKFLSSILHFDNNSSQIPRLGKSLIHKEIDSSDATSNFCHQSKDETLKRTRCEISPKRAVSRTPPVVEMDVPLRNCRKLATPPMSIKVSQGSQKATFNLYSSVPRASPDLPGVSHFDPKWKKGKISPPLVFPSDVTLHQNPTQRSMSESRDDLSNAPARSPAANHLMMHSSVMPRLRPAPLSLRPLRSISKMVARPHPRPMNMVHRRW